MNGLSKSDLYFLALVSSGAVKLDPVEPEYRSEDGSWVFYVPECKAVARNIKALEELHEMVGHQVEQLDGGQDPLKLIDRG